MKAGIHRLFLFGLCILFLTGCSGQSAQSSTPDYQTTKKMVIDMIKSDDGKKAVLDILSEPEVKNQLVLNQDVVKKTITDTLTSDQGKKFWMDMLKDPDFSKALATSMQKNNEQLLKQLMNDPEYQGMLMKVFKAPNMEQEYLDLLQTKPFRDQLQKSILEAVSSPIFTSKLTDAINKEVDQQMKKSGGGKGGNSEQSTQAGG
ncbi:MAG: spore germination lipoprotein GerD [Tuberibacillus sp.]